MRRLFRPVRATVRPGVSRVYRPRPSLQVVSSDKGRRDVPPEDMSALILYGQG